MVTRLSATLLPFALLALGACATTNDASQVTAAVAKDSVEPGTSVTRAGHKMALAKGSLKLNDQLPGVELTDSKWGAYAFKGDGKVKVISVVPSIDTRVCEQQTHVLGDSRTLNPKIERVTISRDLPAAQARFAAESDLTNVHYYSDYRAGGFGKASGLLIEENGLLARSVIVVDGAGTVRYMQVVPDITNLPDMERAFEAANKLVP